MIWTTKKVRGVLQKKAGCAQCEWVSEMRHYGLKGKHPKNTGAIRLEFLNHNCDEFSGKSSQVER